MAKTFEPDQCRGASTVAQGAEVGGTNMGHMADCYVSPVCDALAVLADG
jgi:hypothetical protein